VELETQVSDGAAMQSILAALGFRPSFRYEKYRAEWTDGQGEVVVDHTPIGVLAEIEGAPEWIDRTAARLGVERSSYVLDSYAELFFAWRKRTGSTAGNMTFEECGTARP
jgi:adenylate cyclase class 2